MRLVAAFGLGTIAYGVVTEIPRLTPPRGVGAGSRAAPVGLIVHRPGLLAVGTAPSSAGRAPDLVAYLSDGRIVIRSRSPLPVTVSVSDRHRQAVDYWTLQRRGQSRTQALISGRSYGYCFSQPSGQGYAATRGCGRLVVHRYLNGVRLPDGGAVETGLRVAR